MSVRFLKPVLRSLFLDCGRDHRDTIFVAGSERSGTTWLAELINYRRAFRLIFEPFWSLRVPECRHFSAQQYIRPGDRSSEYLDAARRILSGSVRNPWSDQFRHTLFSRKRLVKDVRANLFLRWAKENFPGMPLVLILRHPCAVASSQERAKHRFGDIDAHFLGQPDLVQDYLRPFLDEMKKIDAPFEQRVFRWCIQNYVPLRQFEPGEIFVVFYEDLCVRPHDTLGKLFDYLELPFEFDNVDLSRPSALTHADSALLTGQSLIHKWRADVTSAEIARTVEILRLFGLESLYDEDSMPHAERLDEFMAR